MHVYAFISESVNLSVYNLYHQACNVSRGHAKGFGQYRNKRRKNAKAKGILTTQVSAGRIRWACPRECMAMRSECSQRHHEDYEVTSEERSLRLSAQVRSLECKAQCTELSGAKRLAVSDFQGTKRKRWQKHQTLRSQSGIGVSKHHLLKFAVDGNIETNPPEKGAGLVTVILGACGQLPQATKCGEG